ncbi:MAG: ABC transporter ATP-binding protein [Anaerolineaceae bacterium]|nr:ABC transporter ATP-binding protein [Anaerolineaceae bacterium]
MLDVNGIYVGYNDSPILKEVSLHIEEGTVLALIGPNGSGKTTFIRAVSGILPLMKGSITIDGIDLSRLNSNQRARKISVVPQARSIPAAFTAEEVVAMGRTPYLNWLGKISDYDQQIIDEALEKMDLLPLRDRTVNELSGGEQQRLFLARSLAQQSPLLLMDEPTTHLDLQYQVNLMQRIYQLAHPGEEERSAGVRPRTVVITMHDLNLISRYADLVGLMVHGKLEAVGKAEEVLRSDLLSRAYQLPLEVIREKGFTLVTPGISEDEPAAIP